MTTISFLPIRQRYRSAVPNLQATDQDQATGQLAPGSVYNLHKLPWIIIVLFFFLNDQIYSFNAGVGKLELFTVKWVLNWASLSGVEDSF